MSKIGYMRKTFAYQFEDIDIYFRYKKSIVYSTNRRTKICDGQNILKAQEIEIECVCHLESYDSLNEMALYNRSEILVILDIISFFTGIPLTTENQISGNSSFVDNTDLQQRKTLLIIEGIDYTEQLNILLECIENEQGLIISLLDRWRKANFLSQESCDANLYHDEAILNYFHIIELFSENEGDSLKDKLKFQVSSFLYEYYKSNNYFANKNQINSKVKEVEEVVNGVLISNELNLSKKIKHFLDNKNLLDENTSYFIDSIVKIRNSIAHGRITYKEKSIWPLPPFFCLAHNSYNILEHIKFLTARMISSYVGIDCWREEWEEAKKFLLPSERILSLFLKGEVEFEEVDSLCLGNSKNITWINIFEHHIQNPRKFSVERIEKGTRNYFLNTKITEDNGAHLFEISIILADSENIDTKEKAINNVKYIIANKIYNWSNYKDIYMYLNYYGVSTKWYKQYLNSKE